MAMTVVLAIKNFPNENDTRNLFISSSLWNVHILAWERSSIWIAMMHVITHSQEVNKLYCKSLRAVIKYHRKFSILWLNAYPFYKVSGSFSLLLCHLLHLNCLCEFTSKSKMSLLQEFKIALDVKLQYFCDKSTYISMNTTDLLSTWYHIIIKGP